MFLNSLLLLVWFAVASAKGGLEKYGPFEILLYSRLLKCEHRQDLNFDVSDIGVHFYDFKHDFEATFPMKDAAENIFTMHLDRHKTWIIYIPGFNSPVSGKSNSIMKDAFQNQDDSYFVVIDHYVYTEAVGSHRKSYEKAVKYAYEIGKAIASFLKGFHERDVPLESIKLIGHSLGSQILGYAALHFEYLTGSKLSKITGLDPAGPCFSNGPIENQIHSGSAEYVEIFHCNAGGYGTPSVLGDVDFFANNKGQFQPHCDVPLVPGLHDSERAAKCSHEACVKIYASTVNHQDWFLARKCDSYSSFEKGTCDADVTIAGFWSPGTARGVYYFSTKAEED